MLQVNFVLDIFQVSVTARDGVPHFGPNLPSPAIFRKVSSNSTLFTKEHLHIVVDYACLFFINHFMRFEYYVLSILGQRIPRVSYDKDPERRTGCV